MIVLPAPICDDHAGFGYEVELFGISTFLLKGCNKSFVSSILPELTVDKANGADAFVLRKRGQVLC